MTDYTYADLKTQIEASANRTDLATYIPYFIKNAEARINYGSMEAPFQSEPLRIQDMETRAYATFDAQRVALPDNFLERRRIYVVLSGGLNLELKYLPPDLFWTIPEASQTGCPRYFTIEDSEFVLAPSPDAAYVGYLLYYEKYDALSADADTNWLLNNAPGIYHDAALIEVWAHVFDQEKREFAHKSFIGKINALNNADKQTRHSGTAWIGRSDTGNP